LLIALVSGLKLKDTLLDEISKLDSIFKGMFIAKIKQQYNLKLTTILIDLALTDLNCIKLEYI